MKKFFLNENEVKLGDKVTHKSEINLPGGKAIIFKMVTLDEPLLNELIEQGVIKLKYVASPETSSQSITPEEAGIKENVVSMDIYFYIEKLAKRVGWNVAKTTNYLAGINELSPMAAFTIVLKEIAMELDKQYKDHIQDSPKIYAISTMDGRISELNKAHIKTYKNFAAFRTIEDAKIACKIMSPILKGLFKSGRK